MYKNLALTALALSALGLAYAFSPTENRRLNYFDPEDRRVHASVEAVVADGRLQLGVSAFGPTVEPLPGFRGRAGANLQTAFEIDQLLAGGRLQVVTFDRNGQRMSSGEVRTGNRGSIPVRRLRHDGNIDYLGSSARKYVLGFAAASPSLPAGAYTTELWARGEPRLRVEFTLDDSGRGYVLEFVEIGHGRTRPENVGEQFRFVTTDGADANKGEETKTSPPPLDAADWNAKDLDAKWLLFRKWADAAETADLDPWINFLLAQKDYEFLEMLALYEIDAFQLYGIGEKLKQANAPNWIRLVAWHQGGQRSRGHMPMVVDGLLMDEESKDEVASWIRSQPGLAEEELIEVIAQLDASEPKPKQVDVSKYQGALKPAGMFRLLDAPDDLPELAAATKGEPDAVYLEQVLRTIDGLVVSNRLFDPWLEKLGKLRDHPHPRVRQAVYLAYTHVEAPSIPATCIEVVKNAEEDPQVREAALLAHSFRNHFEAYPDLLDVAAVDGHPGWSAAVSRLGDLGDGFVLVELRKIATAEGENGALLKASVSAIEDRLKALEESNPMQIVSMVLERVAWMEASGHSRAKAYSKWVNGEMNRHVKSAQMREQLLPMTESNYTAEKGASEGRREIFQKMSTEVQGLASQHAEEH